ncbi:hypothetical protein J6590_059509 [Homalodisca vitripennis]|nr:hypothetical protein J6590_059509 [Homalodisca vitripennis]
MATRRRIPEEECVRFTNVERKQIENNDVTRGPSELCARRLLINTGYALRLAETIAAPTRQTAGLIQNAGDLMKTMPSPRQFARERATVRRDAAAVLLPGLS